MPDSVSVTTTDTPTPDPSEASASTSAGVTVRRLEEAKADLLGRALETAKTHDPALESLVRRYYRHTAPEDLLGRNPEDVLGAVVSHRRTAASRPQGTPSSRSSPTTCRSSSTR